MQHEDIEGDNIVISEPSLSPERERRIATEIRQAVEGVRDEIVGEDGEDSE